MSKSRRRGKLCTEPKDPNEGRVMTRDITLVTAATAFCPTYIANRHLDRSATAGASAIACAAVTPSRLEER